MSTKIYTGVELAAVEPHMLQRRFRKLQKKMQPLAVAHTARFLADTCTTWIDQFAWYGELVPEGNGPYTDHSYAMSYATAELGKRQEQLRKLHPQRDSYVDVKFELVIYPLKGRILGQYFGVKEDMVKLFLAQPWVKDYHYQNSSDRPEEISAKEWSKRQRDWDRVFTDLPMTPALAGWTVVLCDYPALWKTSDVVPYLPSFDDRCKQIARNALVDELMAGKTLAPEKIYHDLLECHKWLETGPGQNRMTEFLKDVRKRLIPQITDKTLLADWRTDASLLRNQC